MKPAKSTYQQMVIEVPQHRKTPFEVANAELKQLQQKITKTERVVFDTENAKQLKQPLISAILEISRRQPRGKSTAFAQKSIFKTLLKHASICPFFWELNPETHSVTEADIKPQLTQWAKLYLKQQQIFKQLQKHQ